ncbi:MAG TPA: hypothetical protein VIT38_15200 [Allosphingosinicella sp.]
MSEALGGIRNLFSVYGLSRIVLCLFLGLTIVATGFGLSDLVTSSDSSALKLVETAVVFALAAAAILAMWVALEFAIEARSWWQRLGAGFFYVLLLLWSIGFGFGFYWKHMASVGLAQTESQDVVTNVTNLVTQAQGRLDRAAQTVAGVANRSAALQEEEGVNGGTCEGQISGPGRRSLFQARGTITARVASISNDVDVWLERSRSVPPAVPGAPANAQGPAADADNTPIPAPRQPGPRPAQGQAPAPPAGSIAAEIAEVIAEARRAETALATADENPEGARSRMLALSARAQSVVAHVNSIIGQKEIYIQALNDAATLSENGVTVAGATCRDSSLAASLRRAAASLREIEPLGSEVAALNPKLGAQATQDAFYRLWNNALPFLATEAPRPMGGRDFVALVAAIVVDLGILFLTIFGRRDGTPRLARLLRLPGLDARLRERLLNFVGTDGEVLRELLDHSLVQFGGGFYLVATEDLPAYFGSVHNLQVVLLAAGEGEVIPLTGARTWPGTQWRAARLEAFRAKLAAAGGQADEPLPAEYFATDKMLVLRLKPHLVFALRNLALPTAAAANEGPRAEPAATDQANGDAGAEREPPSGQRAPEDRPPPSA